jgi:hypothetical protein
MRNTSSTKVWQQMGYGPKPINRTAQNGTKQKSKIPNSSELDKYWCPVCRMKFSTSFDQHRKTEQHLNNRMKKQGYAWSLKPKS